MSETSRSSNRWVGQGRQNSGGRRMRILMATIVLSATSALVAPAAAQTQSSGASGYVQDQDKASVTAQPPKQPYKTDASGDASGATSAKNSGAGISGAP